jgi:hypothetical protein
MADLPADRVTPSKAPFVDVGIDYFGPFMVKQARSTVEKIWMLVYVLDDQGCAYRNCSFT